MPTVKSIQAEAAGNVGTLGVVPSHPPQSLISHEDLAEFRQALDHFKAGRWHGDRWKTFRLRFGIYEQRQAEQHMVRAKLPGGRLRFDQARAIAAANARNAGGDIHLTTRQAVQFYFVPLDGLSPLLEDIAQGGVSTREASGSTFRNITACYMSGFCPMERVEAGLVAERLATTWLRHPLVQHMPRKFKTTVSGCENDCGLGRIDDLGFIATEKDGKPGFRVVAGGGLGIQPCMGVTVFDFIEEADLPAVQEAFARVHHQHSDRSNKNRSRIKFLVQRFGEDVFRQHVRAAFETVRTLPQPPWEPLSWRQDVREAARPPLPRGTPRQPDGRYAVVIEVPLGVIDSGRLSALTDMAELNGASGFVLTRDQNIVVRDMPWTALQPFVEETRGLGLEVSEAETPLNKLVACPGVSTCAIGITNVNALAESLVANRHDFDGLPDARIGISGCHNSCGHHHVADIGLHGMAKKIDGRPAPHYQLHLGGTGTEPGIAGPVIPARQAQAALERLLAALGEGRLENESVRAWAERLGRKEIARIFAPESEAHGWCDATLHLDVGDEQTFVPPETSTGECAAGSSVAEYLSDLAVVARKDLMRAVASDQADVALAHGRRAIAYPAERLLAIAGYEGAKGDAQVLEAVRDRWGHDRALMAALETAVSAQENAEGLYAPETAEPALAAWHAVADRTAECLLVSIAGFLREEKTT